MISIVICSTKNNINKLLEENISKTIGLPYEIILIDNSNNLYSIFTAYNQGIMKAQYPYICFIHEDIMFRSNNWGFLIKESFNNDETIGMIGVIGSPVIFDVLNGWWSGPIVGHVLQNYKNAPINTCFDTSIERSPQLSDAAVCDGLFLAFPKSVFNHVRFDDITFKGFHCYDLDISMQILKSGYKIKTLDNLLIEHFSLGKVDHNFICECCKFQQKWFESLPISCDSFPKEKMYLLRHDFLKKTLLSAFEYEKNARLFNSKKWHIFNFISSIYKYIKSFFYKSEKEPYILK